VLLAESFSSRTSWLVEGSAALLVDAIAQGAHTARQIVLACSGCLLSIYVSLPHMQAYHPDAVQLWRSCLDLEQVAIRLQDLSARLGPMEEVRVGSMMGLQLGNQVARSPPGHGFHPM
jgi:hypothetical protein